MRDYELKLEEVKATHTKWSGGRGYLKKEGRCLSPFFSQSVVYYSG